MSYQLEVLVSLAEDLSPVPSVNMGQIQPTRQTNKQTNRKTKQTTTANQTKTTATTTTLTIYPEKIKENVRIMIKKNNRETLKSLDIEVKVQFLKKDF